MLHSAYNQPELLFLFIFVFSFIHINGPALSSNYHANATDHLALLAIKAEIKQDPQSILDSWNNSLHFCHWQGVTCGRRHGRVTVLNLNSNGLMGSLSPFIGNLSFLREIWLHNNTFHGEIPPEVGRLFRLQVLQLNNNSFEGRIPPNLSHCSNLHHLGLGYNKISGKLPNELGSLSMLKYFVIHHTNVTGEIPPYIGNLTSLEIISFCCSNLQGRIPDVFNRLQKLQELAVGRNDLVGTIPSSIYNMSMLTVLAVSENQLHGSIPANLGAMLPHLQQLQLSFNHISGALPLSISNCSELIAISAGPNNFPGKLAIDFGKLKNLRFLLIPGSNIGSGERDELKFVDSLSNCSNLAGLELSDNELTGVLPNSVGNLSMKLNFLALHGNRLYGSIPSSIGNLLNLTTLRLDDNKFTSQIPLSIGKLLNLQVLSLSTNFLSGSIPVSLGNLSSLLTLDISENNLGGTLPSGIANWQKMNLLWFYQNNLTGIIPKELFALPSLSIVLDLSQNNFSGPIPLEVGQLQNLGNLSLANNNLSGELPGTLGSCSSLEFLYLGGNFFHGSVPSSLSSLKALRELNLSNNNLSGQIPKFLEKIPFDYLDLSHNNFEGEMPVTGVFANASVVSVVGNERLCGGIPQLQLPKCRVKNQKSSLALIVIIPIALTLACASMVSFFVFRCCRRVRKDQTSNSSMTNESFLKVSYETLLRATDGFSEANLIGRGSFSSVYKGVLGEGNTLVAIKVLNLKIRGGSKSFFAECEALRNVRHRNLLKVMTSCLSIDFQGNDFKAIVYEFMSNGSLESWLHSGVKIVLGLLQRISIAIDVACAINYLHQHSGKTIAHCDLKPSNILLDDDKVAHVGDFGLAKFIFEDLSELNNSSSIRIRGTVGYAAPEYGQGCQVSVRGDIYSYGIILLEMVTGKRPTDPMFEGGLDLHRYVITALGHSVLDIVDPKLLCDVDAPNVIPQSSVNNPRGSQVQNKKTTKEECLISLIKIGVACSVESPKDRMDIGRVIHELQSLRVALSGT